MAKPTIAAAATITGSGNFFTFQIRMTLTSAMAAEGQSMIDRLPSASSSMPSRWR